MRPLSWRREGIHAGHSDRSGPARRRAAKNRPAARSRPHLEMLEGRALLSGVSLSLPVSYDAGVSPISVAVGDLNGDGRPDLAVANANSDDVSVLLGNGDGTFQAARSFVTGGSPRSVAIGDFNRDGKQDLAVANTFGYPYGTGNVSLLLGNGDGTFRTAQILTVGFASSLAVGDFNGDGKLDLATTNPFGSTVGNVGVLLGNGDGTFQTAQNLSAGGNPFSVVVRDFNGDGNPDLAVGGSNDVSVLLGNGDGTFRTALSFPVAWASSLAVGDFNGDGKPDLATASENSSNVSVLLGNGDGTFQTAQNFSAGFLPTSPSGLVAGDFNGDGKLDLTTASESNSNSNSVSVLLGNGDGTFQTAQSFPVTSTRSSLAVGDFNGDGKLDLAAANFQSNTVSVLLNQLIFSASGVNVGAIAGAPFSAPIATFTDPDPAGSAASYTASIDWGDGSHSPGTITGTGILTVGGSHTYAYPCTYDITLVINHNQPGFPATATASSTATVANLGQDVQRGLTGGLGFWNNKQGQALINGFNGGPYATALSSWLAASFPNLYGGLGGETNGQVASFYQTRFALSGSNVEAEVLATALNVYASTQSLGGTIGLSYGFAVSADGLGADSFNVGADGAAFGVANNTALNVYELLRAVDRQVILGVLYNGDTTLRKEASDLFDALNKAGSIA